MPAAVDRRAPADFLPRPSRSRCQRGHALHTNLRARMRTLPSSKARFTGGGGEPPGRRRHPGHDRIHPAAASVTLDVKRHHRYFLTNDRELPGPSVLPKASGSRSSPVSHGRLKNGSTGWKPLRACRTSRPCQATRWSPCAATAKASTASASTTNGGSASSGPRAGTGRSTSRSPTITEEANIWHARRSILASTWPMS